VDEHLVKSGSLSRKFVYRTPILLAHAGIDSHRKIALNDLAHLQFRPGFRGCRQHKMHIFEAACHNEAAATRGWNGCERDTLEQGLALSRKAIEFDPHSADGYATLCLSHLWRREHDAAIDAGRQCVALDPNLALGHGALGQALDFSGQHEEALAEFNAAFLLDPRHNLLLNVMGRAQFALGRYEEAEANFRRRLIHNPDTDVTRAYLAALCGETGRTEEAQLLWRELLQISPRFDPMRFRVTYPYKDPTWFNQFYGGLKKAGIIE